MDYAKNSPMISRLFFVLIVIGIAAIASCSSEPKIPGSVSEDTPNPLTDKVAAAETGKDLFIRNCMMCHGMVGKGDGPASSSLMARPADLSSPRVTSMKDGKIFLTIKNGKMSDGKLTMAPTQNVSDREIWEIVAYVRGLK